MADAKEILAPELTPQILYQDEDILAVNKPAGLMVHPDGKNDEPTLCDWLIKKYPEIEGVGEPLILQDGRAIARPGIVHRLDRWTSGVILAAKTPQAFWRLKKQFQKREVKKTYVAFVYGKVKENFGTISLPLGRSKGDFRQHAAPRRPRGAMREAETYFEVIARGKSDEGNFTYLKALPKTGRTHQIRAHLKAVGHPIVCDRVYAKEKPCLLGFDRTALHAKEIVFRNTKGKEIKVEAPFPEDFKKAIGILKI